MLLKIPKTDIVVSPESYSIEVILQLLKDNDIDTTQKLEFTEQFINGNGLGAGWNPKDIDNSVKGNTSVKYSYNIVNDYIYEVKVKGLIVDIIAFCRLFNFQDKDTLDEKLTSDIQMIGDLIGDSGNLSSSQLNNSLIVRYLDKENMFDNMGQTIDNLVGLSSPNYREQLYTLLDLCVKKIYGNDLEKLTDFIRNKQSNKESNAFSYGNINDNLLKQIEDYVKERTNGI